MLLHCLIDILMISLKFVGLRKTINLRSISHGFLLSTENKWQWTVKGKGKVLRKTGPEGEYMYSSTLSSTSAIDGGWGGQRHAPAALPPGESPGTHCTGGWVGQRAGLGGCGKSRLHRDSIPGPSRPWRVTIPTELFSPHEVTEHWRKFQDEELQDF
jgi:hypothetical protein